VPLVTAVPDALKFHGIEPPQTAPGFGLTLDSAEPQGGGRITGRVERRHQRRDGRPVTVEVRCTACWMDVAPQFVGRKGMLTWSAYGDMRNKFLPVWLDEELFSAQLEVGSLADVNWRRFAFDLPDGLPRALEGTFVAFRWRIEARRARRVGTEHASLPLVLQEPQTLPVLRVETSPIGTWRLLEWRSEQDVGAASPSCSIAYGPRREEDLPLPGEDRDAEQLRRAGH
jgi:hypothetical protein